VFDRPQSNGGIVPAAGIKQYGSHGNNMIFANSCKSEDVAESIQILFLDELLRKKIGNNGLNTAFALYSEKEVDESSTRLREPCCFVLNN